MRQALVLLLALAGARGASAQRADPAWFSALEQAFAGARRLADQVSITRSRGVAISARGVPLAELERSLDSALSALGPATERLQQAVDSLPEPAAGRAILTWYRRARSRPDDSLVSSAAATCPAGPERGETAERLEAAIFACYGRAAEGIVVGADTLDRLAILNRLGTVNDPATRERLFRALDGVWSAVNGHDEPGAPFRRLVALRRAQWADAATPMARRGESLGIPGDSVEAWLERALDAWRAALPDTLFEPWDYYHFAGEAARRLDAAIPLDSLLPITGRFYRALGADPDVMGVHYDIAPRPGKYPIAFSDFGGRAERRDGRWQGAEPWVFASYRDGGFGNLNELLHETGHAVHTAAIRTRPAFADWPDSDTFTEAVAELATLEMFEPAWQRAFLGREAPLEASLRAKYAWVMLDVAWALFEFRVHRPGAPSPNTVWTAITERYLRIRPHPELSWWAMRGQLVESPGYMVNYALGAFIVADLRAALTARLGPFTTGQAGWYGEVAPLLFAPGRSRPAATVVREVLAREPRPEALLADLARIRTPGRPRTGPARR